MVAMGNKPQKEQSPRDLSELLQTTRFSEDEINAWYRNFLKVRVTKVTKVTMRSHKNVSYHDSGGVKDTRTCGCKQNTE